MLCCIQITLFRFHGLLETTFLYSQILENGILGYVSFVQFHSIRFDSLGCHITISFSFLFFFFTVSLPLMFVSWFEGLFPLRSSLCLKTEHPQKSLDSCPLSFLLNDHVRKKKRQENEEREITEGTTEKWKKEMVGGKIPGKIGELGRGQQLPSAHYFRLSLVHVTYCFRSRAWGRKREKNGQRQSIS